MSNREDPKTILADARRAWATPSVRRLSAGSAEDGGGNVPDGGADS